ncbi:MAG: hypothetical protein D6732_07070 [Methanobacteriota archaeon]|nr:MAG: hypothetical protein D6732_07070 [Euryarchaeota archaeon]
MNFETYYETKLLAGHLEPLAEEFEWNPEKVNLGSVFSYLVTSIYFLINRDFLSALVLLPFLIGFALHSFRKQLVYADDNSVVFRDFMPRTLLEEFVSQVKGFTKINVEGLMSLRYRGGHKRIVWLVAAVIFLLTGLTPTSYTSLVGDSQLIISVVNFLVSIVKFLDPFAKTIEVETFNSNIRFKIVNPDENLVRFLLEKLGE